MGKSQTAWAKRARLKLIEELGAKCVGCGSLENLELDHKVPANWDRSSVESSHRVSIYRREAAAGKLQVLCGDCNKRKQRKHDTQLANPF